MEKKELKPFDKVLIRDNVHEHWRISLYSHYEDGKFPYCCMGSYYSYCIPYEGNEHLLNTTDEPKKPYEPKDGDFVVIGRYDNIIAIYRSSGAEPIAAYAAYNALHSNLYKDNELEGFVDSMRPAAEEEKNYLLNKMHEAGKDWDAENKKVVDLVWTPQDGELIFFYDWCSQTCRFIACSIRYRKTDGQVLRDKEGNRFRTKRECLVMCDKLNEAIKNVK